MLAQAFTRIGVPPPDQLVKFDTMVCQVDSSMLIRKLQTIELFDDKTDDSLHDTLLKLGRELCRQVIDKIETLGDEQLSEPVVQKYQAAAEDLFRVAREYSLILQEIDSSLRVLEDLASCYARQEYETRSIEIVNEIYEIYEYLIMKYRDMKAIIDSL